jgi:hypothetical protein
MKTIYIMPIVISCILLINVNSKGGNGINKVKDLFDMQYDLYIKAREAESQSARSTAGPETLKELQGFIKLGPEAIPFLIEKATLQPNGQEDHFLTLPLNILTRKIFTLSERTERSVMDSRGIVRLFIQWWKNGRKETLQQFNQRYSQWKDLKNHSKEKEAKDKMNEIFDLGIGALPMMMEKVKQGDSELISIISKLTDKKVDPNFTAEQCISWWEQNKEDWLIPFPNKQPKADAGKNQSVKSGQVVQLDGSSSTDDDKDSLSYQWKQISGPTVKLSDTKPDKPSFTAPKVDKDTNLVFELTVNDGSPKKSVHPSCESGDSKPATVTITIKP